MIDNLDELIKLWFAEDIGDGDHTTLSCIPETAMGKSQLIIKEKGILAGVEVAKRIFATFDSELKMTQFLHDG
ncbi:MAG: nicotinate-nucleotide diphosphorylase (carboxylating), partial [Paludibacteraceae bacterium]|nr:nicotinate-nucleotide diphosphorylase (carboxylating) [Paludibacteraceae bacterium]